MIIKKCPKCLSSKIDLFAGAITGQYNCQKCDYLGSLVIEEEIETNRLHEK